MRATVPRKGRVFISHSSLDRDFVRELDKQLSKQGFHTWLDEKDLLVGDQLAKEIGHAIADAGALIVVVSQQSMKSDWLSYELNLAAERAIKGDLRIIPVVMDSDEMPVELRGRLYADFRTSFDSGLALVVKALEQEEGIARWPWKATAEEVEQLLREVFGGTGFGSYGGEFGGADWSHINVPGRAGREGDASYELVLNYRDTPRPLLHESFAEYVELIQRYPVGLALMITERPIEFFDSRFSLHRRGTVGLTHVDGEGWATIDHITVVVVDISDGPDIEEKRTRLREARRLLEQAT